VTNDGLRPRGTPIGGTPGPIGPLGVPRHYWTCQGGAPAAETHRVGVNSGLGVVVLFTLLERLALHLRHWDSRTCFPPHSFDDWMVGRARFEVVVEALAPVLQNEDGPELLYVTTLTTLLYRDFGRIKRPRELTAHIVAGTLEQV